MGRGSGFLAPNLLRKAIQTNCKAAKTALFNKWMESGKNWMRNLGFNLSCMPDHICDSSSKQNTYMYMHVDIHMYVLVSVLAMCAYTRVFQEGSNTINFT